jgi:HD-GYP domain-containing protein (c-di-GMP phosphodiesterase class II)
MPEDRPERMSIEVIEVSPRIVVPPAGSSAAGEVFRQLLQQAIRVADQANSQAVRIASDFAEVYRREQSVRLDFETKLREMRLLERQSTRYAEDLAQMLRSERERREQLETALESERVANEELRRTGLQGISHLLLAATIKDQTTGAHLLRVRKYVEAIGTRLGLPTQIVEEFGYSSVMHDVGKIHTPDHILQSEHHLSSQEFEVIKQHCIDGEVMLGDARFFETARAIAREHHERWDGRGYPDGLAGEQIPLEARIVFVCDAYHAMTSDRSYRAAMPREAALAELFDNAGTQFDLKIVQVLAKVVQQGEPMVTSTDGVRAVLANTPVPQPELTVRSANSG